MHLKSAEPNWAADPIPNSPRVSASNLLSSARADISEPKATIAAANAVETKALLQLLNFASVTSYLLLEQSSFSKQNSVKFEYYK